MCEWGLVRRNGVPSLEFWPKPRVLPLFFSWDRKRGDGVVEECWEMRWGTAIYTSLLWHWLHWLDYWTRSSRTLWNKLCVLMLAMVTPQKDVQLSSFASKLPHVHGNYYKEYCTWKNHTLDQQELQGERFTCTEGFSFWGLSYGIVSPPVQSLLNIGSRWVWAR